MSIERAARLSDEQRDAVLALIADVTRRDERAPLSDQALTKLDTGDVEHVLARDGDDLVGYAQLDDRSLELAAADDAIGPLLDAFVGRPVLVWTHGSHSRLVRPLSDRGFERDRELLRLGRALHFRPDVPPIPAGITISTFAVGVDEDAWLAVNAAAFAHHPEQGGWTREDVAAREAESWFDPHGFLLARRGAELVGFHWTKVHEDGNGEVYVLGVAPSAQGLHLGTLLLQAGLASLYQRGVRTVLLYVDGDNTTAVRLYERAGFRRDDLDVQWGAPTAEGDQPDQSVTGSVSNT